MRVSLTHAVGGVRAVLGVRPQRDRAAAARREIRKSGFKGGQMFQDFVFAGEGGGVPDFACRM